MADTVGMGRKADLELVLKKVFLVGQLAVKAEELLLFLVERLHR